MTPRKNTNTRRARFGVVGAVESHNEKYFRSVPTQIISLFAAVSSHMRGVSRSSRTRDEMRWTRAALLTRARACGRRSRVVLTPRRWRQVSRKAMSALSGATRRYPRGDGDNKARSPGRARRKPLKPLRREGRGSRRTCGSTPVFFCCTGGCGCAKHPAFPAPSVIERANFLNDSGAERREIAESYFNVIARSEATKQSTLTLLPHGLLRFARNDEMGCLKFIS